MKRYTFKLDVELTLLADSLSQAEKFAQESFDLFPTNVKYQIREIRTQNQLWDNDAE